MLAKRLLIRHACLRNTGSGISYIRHVPALKFCGLGHAQNHSTQAKSPLPFDWQKDGQKFGQLVKNNNESDGDLNQSDHVTSAESESPKMTYDATPSPFRNEYGTFLQGENSEEARLDPRTLSARVDSSMVKLPRAISRAINNNILSGVQPDKLRERAAQIYQALEKEQVQKAPESGLDADAHIAALFLQNYAHAYRVLSELKKRVGSTFNPDSVLDIGYGPGTGMIALNEIMGDEYKPATKDVYVVGRSNKEMKKRAKILLSRQLNEVPDQVLESKSTDLGVDGLREKLKFTENEETNEIEESAEEDDYVGPVDTAQIRIRTRLRDALPSTKQYALIIVNQALLSREYSFPRDVDVNLHMILRLLKPDGHLVIVERGNALGFEVVARARQVMLRPESHRGERGLIPRPYIRGSSVKPQKVRREDQIVTEDHIRYEHELLEKMEAEDELAQMETEDGLAAEIEQRHGKVTEEDMRFEFEETGEYDVLEVDETPKHEETPEGVDYHLSVVAPCPHHGICPLQLGDPKFYKISGHQHRLQFCTFNQVVERPKYTMELKRGKRLATQWNKDAEDGFGLAELSKATKKQLQGSGRPGGHNSEAGNFSYLIMHRSLNDAAALAAIKDQRDHPHEHDTNKPLPRILETPDKIKKNVRLRVCAPSGNVEYWQVPRSVGKQDYHDARKARQGDLWALGKKSAVAKARMSDANMDKLKRMANMQRKFVVKEKRKQSQKKLISAHPADFDDPLDQLDALADDLEQSKKYRTKGKSANFDVDPRAYDGK